MSEKQEQLDTFYVIEGHSELEYITSATEKYSRYHETTDGEKSSVAHLMRTGVEYYGNDEMPRLYPISFDEAEFSVRALRWIMSEDSEASKMRTLIARASEMAAIADRIEELLEAER